MKMIADRIEILRRKHEGRQRKKRRECGKPRANWIDGERDTERNPMARDASRRTSKRLAATAETHAKGRC